MWPVILGLAVCAALSVWLIKTSRDVSAGRREPEGTARLLGGAALGVLIMLSPLLYAKWWIGAGKSAERELKYTRRNIERHRAKTGEYPADVRPLVTDDAHTGSRGHGERKGLKLMTGAEYAARRFGDTGGWYYVVDGPDRGRFGVDCVHKDRAGRVWSEK
jgi:hypothetical protein